MYKLRKFVCSRNRGQVIAASLLLLALLAGIAGTTAGLIEAKNQERLAIAAATAENAAKLDAEARRQEAERNLAFAEKGNDILGSVFAGLDPEANYATVAELRNALRDNLAKAVRELDGSSIGDPRWKWRQCKTDLGRPFRGLGELDHGDRSVRQVARHPQGTSGGRPPLHSPVDGQSRLGLLGRREDGSSVTALRSDIQGEDCQVGA